MTVKQLKKAIEDLPDNMDVMIEKYEDEFNIHLLESATVKICKFIGEKVEPKEKCLILSDEI